MDLRCPKQTSEGLNFSFLPLHCRVVTVIRFHFPRDLMIGPLKFAVTECFACLMTVRRERFQCLTCLASIHPGKKRKWNMVNFHFYERKFYGCLVEIDKIVLCILLHLLSYFSQASESNKMKRKCQICSVKQAFSIFIKICQIIFKFVSCFKLVICRHVTQIVNEFKTVKSVLFVLTNK